MNSSRNHKNGAALVIVLGFLAILTITIIAFTTQTRSERLAGRAYTSSSQARQLLSTALTRAMEDLDRTSPSNYPDFFAFGSRGDAGSLLANSINFDLEEDYFTRNNTLIASEYTAERDSAAWQTVTAQGTAIGRVGYMVINSSGLLDANSIGGVSTSGDYLERRAGTSPAEIQIANSLLTELNSSASASAYPHIDSANPQGILRAASNAELSPGLAFVHNRNKAWRRFETLRDVYSLNQISKPNIITAPIENFSTFSFSPPGDDKRTFMGTNSATLDEDFIKTELGKISAISNTAFVMNQLRDYLDTDSFPEDENGEYTDLSVEPAPLINELILSFDLTFIPEFIETEGDDGEPEIEVNSVTVSNRYSLEVEVWYPFVGYEPLDTFSVHIDDVPSISGTVSDNNMLSGITNWTGAFVIPNEAIQPGATPHDILIFSSEDVSIVGDTKEFVSLFANLHHDITFDTIFCTNVTQDTLVDRVWGLELPMENAVSNDLMPDIEALAEDLFAGITEPVVSNQFVVGMACVDPRLNWNGESEDQWKEEIEVNDTVTIATMGEENLAVISDNTDTPDDTDKIFVRNTDQIDSPWEFTYFLYSTNKPWKTFQMMEVHDDDDTRRILQNLSPYPETPPTHGRINPYSPHESVIASAFLNLPLDEYDLNPGKRLTKAQALRSAEHFMNYYAESDWPNNAANYGTNIYTTVIEDLNTWEQEGFFRNSYELFNPRDTLFTILLAAQNGTDIDSDGIISDIEVRSTQKAVVYIWRDPITQQAAAVFYGSSDTLENAAGGTSWGKTLDAFKPAQ